MFRSHDYTYAELSRFVDHLLDEIYIFRSFADDMALIIQNEVGRSSILEQYNEYINTSSDLILKSYI